MTVVEAAIKPANRDKRIRKIYAIVFGISEILSSSRNLVWEVCEERVKAVAPNGPVPFTSMKQASLEVSKTML